MERGRRTKRKEDPRPKIKDRRYNIDSREDKKIEEIQIV